MCSSDLVTCVLVNNGIDVRCSWFNQPFAARSLKVGDRVYVSGKVKKFKSALQLVNPTLVTPQAGDGNIVPVYKTAIPSRTFAAAVKIALDTVRVNSYVPRKLAEEYGLMPLQAALNALHAPRSATELAAAKRSVAVENLCYVITSYRLLKDDNRDFVYNAPVDYVDRFCDSMPFPHTGDQKKAIDGIIS